MTKNGSNMSKTAYILAIILLLFLSPRKIMAVDIPTDPASLEAMIHNHKTIKAMLEIRFLAEEGVQAYHRKSMKAMEDHAALNKKLDRYRKCFDIIDLILNGTATGFHAYNSFGNCKKNLEAYYKLLETYRKEILFRGAIWTSDTIILHASQRAVEGVYKGASQLWKSYAELSEIVLGVRNCTTADLMMILNDVNTSIDEIESSIRKSYMELWAYMTVRMGFWKKEIYMARTIREIAQDALGRWLGSSIKALECLEQRKSFQHAPLGGGGIIGGRRYN